MFLNRRTAPLRAAWASAALLALPVFPAALSGGCDADIAAKSPIVDSGGPDSHDPPVASAKARVKFKDQGRFVRDLGFALELGPDEVCKELGLYDCYNEAHRITLGGVEPYNRGIRDPLPIAPVTAPIAVDRVALTACATRVDRDFERPSAALVFGDLASNGANAETLAGTARELYRRLLRRDATTNEVESLVGFHAEAGEVLTDSSDDATREWAVASCFAVATSVEGLFY